MDNLEGWKDGFTDGHYFPNWLLEVVFLQEVARARLQQSLKPACSNRLHLPLYTFKKNGSSRKRFKSRDKFEKNCYNMLTDSLPSQPLRTFSWSTLTQRKLKGVGEEELFVITELNFTIPQIPLPRTFFSSTFNPPLSFALTFSLACLCLSLSLLIILCGILYCSNVFIFTFSIKTMICSGEIAFQRLYVDIDSNQQKG